MWNEQATALSERFRLLRYDDRGHGGSPVPPGPTRSKTSLGRDVLVPFDQLEVRHFSFCGLSI
jgi:3-oxoadipate enol-lactonase